MKPHSVKINQEKKNNKRMKAEFFDKDGKKIKTTRFGSSNGETFIDHKDLKTKKNWLARHSKIKGIDYNDPSKPSTLSKDILWNKKSLEDSIKDYKKKHNLK